MKKIICVILMVALLVPLTLYASSTEVCAFDTGSTYMQAGDVSEGDFAAYHFAVTADFDAVGMYLSTYGRPDVRARLELYPWDTDYVTTVAGEPIAAVDVNPVVDNTRNMLEFAVQPAGEYLAVVWNQRDRLAVWMDREYSVGGFFYYEGVEREGAMNMTVRFTQPVDDPFAAVDAGVHYTGQVEVPPESVPAPDSLLTVRPADSSSWTATDGLGRTLPTNEEVGDVKEDKIVAMFYWDWHERARASTVKPFNVQKAYEQAPEAKNDYNHPIWAGAQWMNFWNEPIYGYYSSLDEWVLRKQAELLADAGVDVIFFDNTNGTYTWRECYTKVFKVFAQARADGVNTPKISFLLPFGSVADTQAQMHMLYEDIYKPGKYQELWFYFDGKPMVMANKGYIDPRGDKIDKEIISFFTFRSPVAGYTDKSGEAGSWGWLSTYPQASYPSEDGSVEQITVATALNHNYVTDQITAMNGEHVMGRTYTSKGVDTSEDAVLKGACFSEQFEYAISQDPKVIFITGWNEWCAGRYDVWGATPVLNAFPDEFNDEFSRDLEPSKGKLKDHYYYLLASYIRKFKGAKAVPEATCAKKIDIAGSVEQWKDVGPDYVAYQGNTEDRNGLGFMTTYTETSGRNDFTGAKVARDADNIYFYVQTSADIVQDDHLWMNLYIDCTDEQGWNTFDYVCNKSGPGVLDKFTGNGYESVPVGTVDYSVQGNVLQIKIPKKMLGVADTFSLHFKWTDNVHDEGDYTTFSGDIMDFYISGDVAPGGRYTYAYAVTDPLFGDANGDGKVTLEDVITAAKAVLQEAGTLPCQDLNGDGNVTLTDVILIAKKAMEQN